MVMKLCAETELENQVLNQYQKLNATLHEMPRLHPFVIPLFSDICFLVHEETNQVLSEKNEQFSGIPVYSEFIEFEDTERYTFNYLYENNFSFRFIHVINVPVVKVW